MDMIDFNSKIDFDRKAVSSARGGPLLIALYSLSTDIVAEIVA